MEEVKVYYDRTGNTLTVWFGDPLTEDICEEVGEDLILMRDAEQQVLGFELINFLRSPAQWKLPDKVHVSVETFDPPI